MKMANQVTLSQQHKSGFLPPPRKDHFSDARVPINSSDLLVARPLLPVPVSCHSEGSHQARPSHNIALVFFVLLLNS